MPDRLPIDALQAAIYSRLTDPTYGIATPVYDHVPLAAALPFVVFDEWETSREESKTSRLVDATWTFSTFSAADGYLETNDIADALIQSLTTRDPAMSIGESWQISLVRLESARAYSEIDDDGDVIRRGEVRLRFICEDVS